MKKKIYLLLAAVLLSAGAHAQGYVDQVVNGNCEGDDVSCFYTVEWVDGERRDGPARLVTDPTDAANRCIVVSSRNKTVEEFLETFDTQFFLTISENLEPGDKYSISFRVRADKPAVGLTQAFNKPFVYNHWDMLGEIPFTEQWSAIERTGTITEEQAWGGMHTIAFNLAVLEEANNYYFDDFKFLVKKANAVPGFSSCTLTAQAQMLTPGGSSRLSLNLDNGDEKVSAFQFDITLPQGVTLAEDGEGYACTLADRCNGMKVQVVENRERLYTLVAFFLDNDKAIDGTSGSVVTLTLKADEVLSVGELQGAVDNIILSNLDYEVLKVAPTTFPITISGNPLGDVNHDGEVNVVDVMMTVSEILGKRVKDFHAENADVNGDNTINISDVMGIVDLVLHHIPNIAPAHVTSDCVTAVPVPGGVDLCLDNASRYTAMEMTLELPQGASLTRASLCKGGSHQVETCGLGGGLHRIIVYSLSGEPLAGGDALLHLDIAGGGDVKVCDVMLADTFCEGLAPQEATGIVSVEAEGSDSPAYSINGMRTSGNTRGVVIRNGKKTLQTLAR